MPRSRYAVVLDIRRQAEDTIKRELGQLEANRAGIAGEITGLHQALDGAALDVPPEMREQLALFSWRIRREIADAEGRLAKAEADIDACRTRLAAAHRDVRAIEALIDREKAAAAKAESKREARRNDEFAARRQFRASA
jgi:flagellar export protein FliJ